MTKAPCHHGLHSKVAKCYKKALACIKGEDNELHMYQQTVYCTACNFKCITLTVVSCHLLPTPTAVSTQSKRAHWCNSHFIHCTKIEVGDGVWGCTRARHWASGVRGGSTSPVLHRVTSDHLTRSQYSFAPSDSDLTCFIQRHHWHTSRRRLRYICWREWWSLDKQWALYRILCHPMPYLVSLNSNTCNTTIHVRNIVSNIQLCKSTVPITVTVLAICSWHVK